MFQTRHERPTLLIYSLKREEHSPSPAYGTLLRPAHDTLMYLSHDDIVIIQIGLTAEMLPVGLTHELSGMCMLLVCALRVSLYLVPGGIGASSVACAVVLSSCVLVLWYRCTVVLVVDIG